MFNSWEANETHAHGIKSTLQNAGRDVLRVSKEQKCKPTPLVLSSDKGLVAGTTLAHEEYFQNSFMNTIYKDHKKHSRRGFFLYYSFLFGNPHNC